jgi:hypothetical protein
MVSWVESLDFFSCYMYVPTTFSIYFGLVGSNRISAVAHIREEAAKGNVFFFLFI